MRVFVAVLYDLWQFFYTACFDRAAANSLVEILPAPAVGKSTVNDGIPRSPLPPPIVVQPAPIIESQHANRTDVGYVLASSSFLYALPARMFDGVILSLPYAASFQILGAQGKWWSVDYGGVQGWVHRDDVTRSQQHVLPCFTRKINYSAESKATDMLRTLIADEFHAADCNMALQNVEYVTYKLAQHNIRIAWPGIRPRIAGTWQKILKRVEGVYMGIRPKKGAVIEYMNDNNVGHVAFVESVYPDESITLSEIGFIAEGVFSERTLSKQEWLELRPVFIEVS